MEQIANGPDIQKIKSLYFTLNVGRFGSITCDLERHTSLVKRENVDIYGATPVGIQLLVDYF